MNKKMIVISIILVSILSGCSLAENFQSAREEYLETRVVELLEEMTPAAGDTDVTPIATLAEATEESAAEVTEEPTAEVTEEAAEEATEEATEEAEATATTEATEEADEKSLSPDPAVYLGDPEWEDDMTELTGWPTTENDFNSITYDNEKLMITALSDLFGWRIAPTEALGDAYIEMSFSVDECSGSDSYGIIFRVPENTGYNRGYLFGITCDGKYSLRSWDGLTGSEGVMTTLQKATASEFITAGSDQSNRLGVMAIDGKLTMYINGEKVDEVSDTAFSDGYFGVFINRDNTEDLTIYMDDVKYWLDPTVK